MGGPATTENRVAMWWVCAAVWLTWAWIHRSPSSWIRVRSSRWARVMRRAVGRTVLIMELINNVSTVCGQSVRATR